MMFPIPRELTTSGFEVGVNVDLSESDKQLARTLYPPFKNDRPRAP
jgi:hypothetical protein